MMILKYIFCIAFSFSVGSFISLAYISLVNSIGLIRNMILKHNTKGYENFYIISLATGIICGSILSFYPGETLLLNNVGKIICLFIGFFYGCFVGYLALSLAEVFDVIPIFNNKVGFRYNLKLLIITIAISKLLGSIMYFLVPGFYEY